MLISGVHGIFFYNVFFINYTFHIISNRTMKFEVTKNTPVIVRRENSNSNTIRNKEYRLSEKIQRFQGRLHTFPLYLLLLPSLSQFIYLVSLLGR